MTGAVDQHRQEKIRRLERENEHLHAHRQRLERLLGLACWIVARETIGNDPLGVLAVLEAIDRTAA